MSKVDVILSGALVTTPAFLLHFMQATPFLFTPEQLVLGLITVASVALNWRFVSVISALKLDMAAQSATLRSEITNQLDVLRREFSSGFVPSNVASAQQSSVMHRVETMEREVEKNRMRIHDISGDIMSGLTAQIFQIKEQLTDKARRMASWEAKMQAAEGMAHDHANQIGEITRTLNDILRRHQEIDRERRN